jgi:hypothetical protein
LIFDFRLAFRRLFFVFAGEDFFARRCRLFIFFVAREYCFGFQDARARSLLYIFDIFSSRSRLLPLHAADIYRHATPLISGQDGFTHRSATGHATRHGIAASFILGFTGAKIGHHVLIRIAGFTSSLPRASDRTLSNSRRTYKRQFTIPFSRIKWRRRRSSSLPALYLALNVCSYSDVRAAPRAATARYCAPSIARSQTTTGGKLMG